MRRRYSFLNVVGGGGGIILIVQRFQCCRDILFKQRRQ